MSKEKIVQLHKDLTELRMMFNALGLIEDIDADKLRAIETVQEILETMLQYIKRTQK